jgi:hypothetical protein
VLGPVGFTAPDGFGSYVADVRRQVIDMVEAGPEGRSNIWAGFLRYVRYVFDLPDEHLVDLRLHTHHFTGDGYLPYFEGTIDGWLARAWAQLTAGVPAEFRCYEPAGGLGMQTSDGLVSVDGCRYQTVVNALRKADHLRGPVVEIGAGYGGLTRHLRRMTGSNVAYIVDLPEMLFFSAVYLRLADDQPVTICTDGPLPAEGYVLIPHYRADLLREVRVPTAVNVMSFQEMTTGQVAAYVDLCAEVCEGGALLSYNHDRHASNEGLTSVWRLLGERASVERVGGVEPQDRLARRIAASTAAMVGLRRRVPPAGVDLCRFPAGHGASPASTHAENSA